MYDCSNIETIYYKRKTYFRNFEGLVSKRDRKSCLTWLKEYVQGSGEIVMSIVDCNKRVPTPSPLTKHPAQKTLNHHSEYFPYNTN